MYSFNISLPFKNRIHVWTNCRSAPFREKFAAVGYTVTSGTVEFGDNRRAFNPTEVSSENKPRNAFFSSIIFANYWERTGVLLQRKRFVRN